MNILFSIIIVNYNTEGVLKECLASVFEKTIDCCFEVIVVDNNSNRESLNQLVEAYPTVKFEFLDKNMGFGAANNIGAKLAKGKYLLFLNPDTILLNNAIEILSIYMEKNPQTGICGGNLYRKDLSPASSFYDVDFMIFEYKIIFNIKRELGFNHTLMPKNVKVIVGADFFIRKDIFLNLKGFDADFFMYFEEVELCYRAKKLGFKITSVPEAKIIHLQGQSAENKNDELKKWSYQEHWFSKWIFFHKTKGERKTKLLYHAHMSKFKIASWLYSLMQKEEKLDYWRKKKSIINNTYQKYKEKGLSA